MRSEIHEKMSEGKDEDTNKMMICASCGAAGGDDIKLKDCDDCDLVRYCSDKCQDDHRPQHKEECKKRAAELHDEILFKQPESTHLGDCPICCVPLSIDPSQSGMYSCCSKLICIGRDHANTTRELERRLRQKCPFCRKNLPKTKEEYNSRMIERVEANDPIAICNMGTIKGDEGDYRAAFDYFSRAAVLGDTKAHFQLSCSYGGGKGVGKDEKKQIHHLTEAAIGGHPLARRNLAYLEGEHHRMDRAVKHYIIASKLGCDDSLKCVRDLCKDGHASKEDYAAALRGYQAAIDATKSPQREEAYEFLRK